jgi:hypothetical protein
MASTQHQFCGNTVNTFGCEDQNFHWSRAFSYYSTPIIENQVIWTSGIARAGCIPAVFYCKDLVSWCANKFIAEQIIIPLHNGSFVSLSPRVFRQMLKLPEPTLTFKGEDCKQFLAKNNNGLDLLPHFLERPNLVPKYITNMQVSSYRNSFREIVWLFTRITRQESTGTVSCMALYILYFTFKEQALFDWDRLISHEISSQLSTYKREKKFYMSSYLDFAIAHSCQFPQLSMFKKVNCEFHPVTFWYQALWKHKASHYFYEVFNGFLSVFKVLLLGENAPRISKHATSFLDNKGTLQHLDNYTVIRIFGSTEQPSLLPFHITNIIFIAEVARQYSYWFHLFQRKKKKHFIPLPWKIGGVRLEKSQQN